ncbi:cyclin-dependent kinase [Ophiocordyceps camponoti-floridani]|uniref:Cyclin-dependent kinase n=1 Tax=Ophiocordyceps camponoti-floridani TaxID=2030778 RepID=A0A8H4VGD6_9HYPO|nr:cyclin-dependent kinase [Ophiocordyceps camponoti-floridani]
MLPSRHATLAPPLDPRAPTSVASGLNEDTPRRLPDEATRDDKAPATQARDATSQTTTTVVGLSSSTDQIVTPPASDTSAGLEDPGPGGGIGAAMPDAAGSRKRMADGAVKGHSRTTSAVSMASTSASVIAEMSAGLQAHLSYASFKLRNGWESRSFDEVELLASQAVSPTSTVSTSINRRRFGSSTSPHQPAVANPSATARLPLADDPMAPRRPSDSSSPSSSPGRSVLAPPAPIRPTASSVHGTGPNPRRNSNPRHTPTMLSRPALASPRTPRPGPRPDVGQPPISRAEQDVAESLLFMSSPGNSANIKHATLPRASSQSTAPPGSRAAAGRHALPSGPRKALPTQRPSKAATGMGPPPPDSPMDMDPPRHPNRAAPQRRRAAGGGSSHVRAALSLPSGLGLGRAVVRRPLGDEDIERLLDRVGDEPPDSSDDEEIQLPRRDVAGLMGA